MKILIKTLATLVFTGYFPVAPGTVGTLIAFLIYLITPETIINWQYFFTIPLLLFLPSVYLTGTAEKEMNKDDKRIVLDEFIGYLFAVMFLPKNVLLAVLAFILFRIFDILKPPPINKLQQLKSGWGIVVDDVVAGIYSNICLQFFYLLVLKNTC